LKVALLLCLLLKLASPTETCSLSLHDALPIYSKPRKYEAVGRSACQTGGRHSSSPRPASCVPTSRTERSSTARWRVAPVSRRRRSEEHTSELQSPDHLLCRLLLEKKQNTPAHT